MSALHILLIEVSGYCNTQKFKIYFLRAAYNRSDTILSHTNIYKRNVLRRCHFPSLIVREILHICTFSHTTRENEA